MKQIHASEMLVECEAFDVPEGLQAFVGTSPGFLSQRDPREIGWAKF